MAIPRYRPAVALPTTLAALALSFGLTRVFASEWAGGFGLDVWNLPGLARTLDQEDAREVQLAANANSLHEQITASGGVIRELIAGRISLAAAAEELEVINRERSGFSPVLAIIYPDCRTHRDRLARWVIREVGHRLAADPSRQAAVVTRLEGEYATMSRAD